MNTKFLIFNFHDNLNPLKKFYFHEILYTLESRYKYTTVPNKIGNFKTTQKITFKATLLLLYVHNVEKNGKILL